MTKEDAFDTTPDPWVASGKDEEVGTTTRFTDGTAALIGAQDQLQRGLKSRHIQFLALGGAYVLAWSHDIS